MDADQLDSALRSFLGGLSDDSTVQERLDVREMPSGSYAIADAPLLILPSPTKSPDGRITNVNTADALEVKKLLCANGLLADFAEASDGILVQESAAASLPEFLLSAQAIFTDPNVLTILLNVVSNFVYDRVKGLALFAGRCKLVIHVTRPDGSATTVEYEGPATSLDKVDEAVRAAAKLR